MRIILAAALLVALAGCALMMDDQLWPSPEENARWRAAEKEIRIGAPDSLITKHFKKVSTLDQWKYGILDEDHFVSALGRSATYDIGYYGKYEAYIGYERVTWVVISTSDGKISSFYYP